jgi:hypothetical protein
MLTSFAPSPIASRMAEEFFLTSLTTRAFCRGETRPEWSETRPQLHVITHSRQPPESQHPASGFGGTHLAHDRHFQKDHCAFLFKSKCQALSIDDKCEFFGVTSHTLIFDCKESLVQKILRVVCIFGIDDDLPSSARPVCRLGLTRFIDSEMRRQDKPMLIAVSCLSPVKTQTLMPACCKV